MQPIKHPLGRLLIHLFLWIVVFFSTFPFIWTFLQSLKTKKQAHSRTPLIWFKTTGENYSELWLESVPDNFATLAYSGVAILLILVLLAFLGRRHLIPTRFANWTIVIVLALLVWAIPQVLDTAEFYDYFVNTIIVGIGAVIISISIAALSAYGLARYVGLAGVILILLALAFRSLPRLAFILPYYWMGQASGLYDTHFLTIITLAAVNQPFSIYMLRSFFMDIPREIEEAAMMDGASRLRAFLQVIVPIMWPGIIATALFTLVAGSSYAPIPTRDQRGWLVTPTIRGCDLCGPTPSHRRPHFSETTGQRVVRWRGEGVIPPPFSIFHFEFFQFSILSISRF